MNTNEIFNQMLSSYDITTELQKRNAFLRSISRLFLQVFTMVAFLMRLLSMVEHACAYSMDCSVSQRIWIFPCLLQMRTLTLPNTFSLSLTNSLWWAERLKSEKGQEEFWQGGVCLSERQH